ncbi:hypothetical protein L1887_48321 [Cichorium endivia]|nr:hypothetical protein L1887_48321 [Cichorium endivia]
MSSVDGARCRGDVGLLCAYCGALLLGWLCGLAGGLDDLEDVLLFVDKLLVVLVVVEVGEELDQTLAVAPQDVFDLRRLLGVGDKHLEHVEGLKLDVLAAVAQQIHHHLEVVLARNVARHDGKVGAVQQDLAEQLERLSLGDVVGRLQQRRIRRKEAVVVGLEVGSHHGLVARERLLEVAKGIARDAKRCCLDVVREGVEAVAVQQDLGERLVAQHLAQDHARVERHLGILVSAQRRKDDVRSCGEHVVRVDLLRQLRDLVGLRLGIALAKEHRLDLTERLGHLVDRLASRLARVGAGRAGRGDGGRRGGRDRRAGCAVGTGVVRVERVGRVAAAERCGSRSGVETQDGVAQVADELLRRARLGLEDKVHGGHGCTRRQPTGWRARADADLGPSGRGRVPLDEPIQATEPEWWMRLQQQRPKKERVDVESASFLCRMAPSGGYGRGDAEFSYGGLQNGRDDGRSELSQTARVRGKELRKSERQAGVDAALSSGVEPWCWFRLSIQAAVLQRPNSTPKRCMQAQGNCIPSRLAAGSPSKTAPNYGWRGIGARLPGQLTSLRRAAADARRR